MNKILKAIVTVIKVYMKLVVVVWAIVGWSHWIEYCARNEIYSLMDAADKAGDMMVDGFSRIKKYWSWTKPSGYFRED